MIMFETEEHAWFSDRARGGVTDLSKAMKLGKKELLIFKNGTKMYRWASKPEGY